MEALIKICKGGTGALSEPEIFQVIDEGGVNAVDVNQDGVTLPEMQLSTNLCLVIYQLMCASFNGHSRLCSYLLDKGADLKAHDKVPNVLTTKKTFFV